MDILESPLALRHWVDARHHQSRRVALVPTMGYLHIGHVKLVEHARQLADEVVATIFVNPTQFGPTEDLSRYPRDLEGDLAKLRVAGVNAVFTPRTEDMYPEGFATYVVPERLGDHLCGKSRPGHFRGVCTVVHMLLRMSRVDVAVFGEKDYQQLQIIRRMARDLWLDAQVVGVPIVRAPDGLAMSSRNAYLSADERKDALALSAALAAVRAAYNGGERHAAALRAAAEKVLKGVASARVDYVSLVDTQELQPVETLTGPTLCALAVFIGKTRLIDNCVLGGTR